MPLLHFRFLFILTQDRRTLCAADGKLHNNGYDDITHASIRGVPFDEGAVVGVVVVLVVLVVAVSTRTLTLHTDRERERYRKEIKVKSKGIPTSLDHLLVKPFNTC